MFLGTLQAIGIVGVIFTGILAWLKVKNPAEYLEMIKKVKLEKLDQHLNVVISKTAKLVYHLTTEGRAQKLSKKIDQKIEEKKIAEATADKKKRINDLYVQANQEVLKILGAELFQKFLGLLKDGRIERSNDYKVDLTNLLDAADKIKRDYIAELKASQEIVIGQRDEITGDPRSAKLITGDDVEQRIHEKYELGLSRQNQSNQDAPIAENNHESYSANGSNEPKADILYTPSQPPTSENTERTAAMVTEETSASAALGVVIETTLPTDQEEIRDNVVERTLKSVCASNAPQEEIPAESIPEECLINASKLTEMTIPMDVLRAAKESFEYETANVHPALHSLLDGRDALQKKFFRMYPAKEARARLNAYDQQQRINHRPVHATEPSFVIAN
jgi:hypothetical protein